VLKKTDIVTTGIKLGSQYSCGDLSGITYIYADRTAGADIELKTKDFYGYLTGLTRADADQIARMEIDLRCGTPLSSDLTGFIRAYAD